MKYLLTLVSLSLTLFLTAAESKETKAVVERTFLSEHELKKQQQLRANIETLPSSLQRHIGEYAYQPGPWFWDLFLQQLPDTKDAVISGNGNVIMRSKDNVLYEYTYTEVASTSDTPTKSWRWKPIELKNFKGNLVRLNDDGSVLLANFTEKVEERVPAPEADLPQQLKSHDEHSVLVYIKTDQEISFASQLAEHFEEMSDDASVCITGFPPVGWTYIRVGNFWQKAKTDLENIKIPFEQTHVVHITPNGHYYMQQSFTNKDIEFFRRIGDKFWPEFYLQDLPLEGGLATIQSNATGSISVIAQVDLSSAVLITPILDAFELFQIFKKHELGNSIPPIVSKFGDILIVRKNTAMDIYKIIDMAIYRTINWLEYRITGKKLKLVQTTQHTGNDRNPLSIIPCNMQFMSYDAHVIAFDRLLVFSAETEQWEAVRALPSQAEFVSNSGFVIKTNDGILAIRPEARKLSPEQLNIIKNLYMQHKDQPKKTIILGQPFNMPLSDADKEAVQKDLQLFTSLPSIVQKIVRDRLNVITINDPSYKRYERRKKLEQSPPPQKGELAEVD